MSVTPSEHSLDQVAFRDLHQRYNHRLVSSLIGVVRDKDRAEDIAAKAFQIAWERRQQFRSESSLYTWLYAIASNEARRRTTRAQWSESLDSLQGRQFAAEHDLPKALEQNERGQMIRKALDRIPFKSRQVLVDHFLNGHSVARIARRRRIPRGTVLSRIFTAKRYLRNAWSEVT